MVRWEREVGEVVCVIPMKAKQVWGMNEIIQELTTCRMVLYYQQGSSDNLT